MIEATAEEKAIGLIKQEGNMNKVPGMRYSPDRSRMAVVGVAITDPSNQDTRAGDVLVCESRYSTLTYQHYHPKLAADMPRSACSCRDLLGSDGSRTTSGQRWVPRVRAIEAVGSMQHYSVSRMQGDRF
jgi:hypothetical protein